MIPRGFHRMRVSGLTVAVLALLVACAPAAQPTSAPPASGSQATKAAPPPEKAAPAAEKLAAAKPAAEKAAASEWDQIVAAAKREGTVVVSTSPGANVRTAFVEDFEKKYPDIKVDLSAGRGTEASTKVITEQQANQFRTDLIVNGTTTQLELRDAGTTIPIAPYLVGPDAKDQSKWLGAKFDFSDDAATHNLVFLATVKVPLAYNPQQANPSELKSYRSLLDPKWRGKMVMLDPRDAGTGLAFATFFYIQPELGKQYMGQLFEPGRVVFSKDERQILDWIARGQYAIAISPTESFVVEMNNKGIQIPTLGADSLAEGSYLTAAWGAVSMLKNPPHPNASKVYLNWMLSQEGQAFISKHGGYPSRRLDVSTDHLNPQTVAKQGIKYQEPYKEALVKLKDDVVGWMNDNIKG